MAEQLTTSMQEVAMAAPQLVYCVEDIFGQCLADYEVAGFRISAYQRGYKWAGEVDKLLRDLDEARRAAGPGEYYLQYITVKKLTDPLAAAGFLDVIDGQQRLTTLSLLFAVLAQWAPGRFAFADQRLRYEVREDFLHAFVYGGQVARLLKPTPKEADAWPDFVRAHPAYDCQDVWYLFRAARTMQRFLRQLAGQEGAGAPAVFGRYVARQVQLIVNAVDGPIASEKVFRNLNSGRVALTETELLKGLLLTRVAREPAGTNTSAKASPWQVAELRTAMGRHWDEMTHWLNRPTVAEFFKPAGLRAATGAQLLPLLRLVAQQTGYAEPADAESRFPVFEHLHQRIRAAQPTATVYFDRLRLLFALLQNWYNQAETYNLLGFLLFSKQVGEREKSRLLGKLTDEAWLAARQREGLGMREYLRQRIGELACLRADPAELHYGDADAAIHDLLLLVNVFPKRPAHQPALRFNFAGFSRGSWSLEHINPQTPDLATLRQLSPADRKRVTVLVEPSYQPTLRKLLHQQAALTADQQAQLAACFRPAPALLHGLGNLVLLERGHNSVLRNAWFAEKRRRIVALVSTGGFVPPHTFHVFSRLLLPSESGAAVWTKADIDAHYAHLVSEHHRLATIFCPTTL